MRFGAALRQLRKHQNKTLREVADEINVTITYLSDVERGKRPPLSLKRTAVALRFLDEEDAKDHLERFIPLSLYDTGKIEFECNPTHPLCNVLFPLAMMYAQNDYDLDKLIDVGRILEKDEDYD